MTKSTEDSVNRTNDNPRCQTEGHAWCPGYPTHCDRCGFDAKPCEHPTAALISGGNGKVICMDCKRQVHVV